MEDNDKYAAQKKYLNDKRKRLSVWVEAEKYNLFKETVHNNGDSMYRLINDFIDDYLASH